MTPQTSSLLVLAPMATLSAALGMVIRRRGPQGFVHGMGDWNRLAPGIRRRVGQVVGNVMFGMAALIACFAGYSYLDAGDSARIGVAGLLLTSGLVALTLGMIRYLQRVQKSAHRDRHDR